MLNKLKGLWSDEKGQGMVEYIIIVAVVAIGAIVAFKLISGAIAKKSGDIATTLQDL
jgi:Flp pilus assembly pilin Flp